MTTLVKSADFVPDQTVSYENFSGIDRSRDRASLENMERQPLWVCENAYCDWRGAIVREPNFLKVKNTGSNEIRDVKFYSVNGLCWAEGTDHAINLNSDRDHVIEDAFARDDVVSLSMFRGNVFAFAKGKDSYKYNGAAWKRSDIPLRPAFGVSVQGRFAVAGMPDKPTEIHLSRVGSPEIMNVQEVATSEEATRAAFIDVRTLIDTADVVTGLGVFEINRLAIFTNDQTLVYRIEPDYTKWTIDTTANVRIGCISHRSIVNVGSDLVFCSRHGVHSLRRSDENGVTIQNLTLSDQITSLYTKLVRGTADTATISATYDPDESTIYIFFPRTGANSIRLSLSIRAGYEKATWSTGTTVGARCGDALGGRLVFGSPGGIYEMTREYTEYRTGHEGKPERGKMVVATPTLWHGDINDQKQITKIVIQATGTGTLVVKAFDDEGIELTTKAFNISSTEEDTDIFPDRPLDRNYELTFPVRYRGLQLQFESDDGGDIKIFGFAVKISVPKKR